MPVKKAASEAAISSAVTERLKGNLGSTTDKLYVLKERQRELEEKVNEIKAEYAALEEQLLARLDAEESTKCGGKKATASVTFTDVADVENWDEFHAWIKKTGNFQVLQKRVSDAAWREIRDLKKAPPPGTKAFTKKRLNLRAI